MEMFMTELVALPAAGWFLTAIILVLIHTMNKHGDHEDYGASERGWLGGSDQN